MLSPSIEPEAGTDDVGDGVDHDFGVLARVGLVVDTERVRSLVDDDPQLRVRRRVSVDDDPLIGPIAPASAAGGRGLKRDGVAARTRERRGWFDQVRMTVTGQRLARRLKRSGLAAVESIDLAAVKARPRAEETPPLLFVGLGRGVSVEAVRWHRREDPDGVLAFADAVAE